MAARFSVEDVIEKVCTESDDNEELEETPTLSEVVERFDL